MQLIERPINKVNDFHTLHRHRLHPWFFLVGYSGYSLGKKIMGQDTDKLMDESWVNKIFYAVLPGAILAIFTAGIPCLVYLIVQGAIANDRLSRLTEDYKNQSVTVREIATEVGTLKLQVATVQESLKRK